MRHNGRNNGAGTPVTWILVADGRTAQIYTKKMHERCIPLAGNGKRRRVELIHEQMLEPILAKALVAESPADYQVGRNQTGAVFECFSSARHMAEPHVDVRKEVKQHFAQRIAHLLSTAKMGRAFSRLVLVAPPEMLGEIDSRLDASIRRKVVARIPKEFTHLDVRTLWEHLQSA